MAEIKRDETGRVLFTKEMRREYTILLPMMLPIHFHMLEKVFTKEGYHVAILEESGFDMAQEGLRYVHNDTCYPALVVIGQLIRALKSGKYDPNKTAYMITQTGGGCRASNYVPLIRKALKSAGFEQVPVIAINMNGVEKNEGFDLNLSLLLKAAVALFFGDILMCLRNQVRAYEVTEGEADRVTDAWIERIAKQLEDAPLYPLRHVKWYTEQILMGYAKVAVQRTPKVKVGIVGEIYVKYSKIGNNNLEDFLHAEDCEIMVPGVMGFMMYSLSNRLEDQRLYGGHSMKKNAAAFGISLLTKMENAVQKAFKKYPQFTAPSPFEHTKEKAEGLISRGTKMGEGWLLSAEILELVDMGYENVVCTQPFGCLPNHICGKGMFRKIKTINPRANIVAVDYDASASRVNQENRIRLMLCMARENLQKDVVTAPECVKEPMDALQKDLAYSL